MPHADLKAHLAVGDVLVPVSLCLLAAVGGVINGVSAYEYHFAPFYAMTMGRSYDNVLASSPGVAYWDAGQLRFAETSTVQVDKSVGYRQHPRYCVAPILDTGPAQMRKISFWAIGMDCCSNRGGFQCGAIGGGHGGIRVVPDGLFVQSRRQFASAIEQAASISGFVVDEDPILVHWVGNTDAQQWTLLWGGLASLGYGALGFLIVTFVASAFEMTRFSKGGTLPL